MVSEEMANVIGFTMLGLFFVWYWTVLSGRWDRWMDKLRGYELIVRKKDE